MEVALRGRYTYILMIALFAKLCFFSSCGKETKSAVDFTYDPEVIPQISTDSVTTLISDSGIIRYKVITKTWDMYEDAKEKFWFFPNGLYLEQFDSLFNVVMSVKSDTGWRYISKDLWKLKGNVHIVNYESNFTYISEEFFWNMQKKVIYSDSLVYIEQPGKLTEYGMSFFSDQALQNPIFRDVGRYPGRKSQITIEENEQQPTDNDTEENTE
jgi:LPS export ABC transporter protein LptC